jgi:hypothetical protein
MSRAPLILQVLGFFDAIIGKMVDRRGFSSAAVSITVWVSGARRKGHGSQTLARAPGDHGDLR